MESIDLNSLLSYSLQINFSPLQTVLSAQNEKAKAAEAKMAEVYEMLKNASGGAPLSEILALRESISALESKINSLPPPSLFSWDNEKAAISAAEKAALDAAEAALSSKTAALDSAGEAVSAGEDARKAAAVASAVAMELRNIKPPPPVTPLNLTSVEDRLAALEKISSEIDKIRGDAKLVMDEAKNAAAEARASEGEAKAAREEAKVAREEAKAAREEARAVREESTAQKARLDSLDFTLSQLKALVNTLNAQMETVLATPPPAPLVVDPNATAGEQAAAALSALRGEVNAIRGSLPKLRGDLEASQATQGERIGALESKLAGDFSGVSAALTAGMGDLSAALAKLTGDMGALGQRVGGAENTIGVLARDTREVKNTLEIVLTDVAELKARPVGGGGAGVPPGQLNSIFNTASHLSQAVAIMSGAGGAPTLTSAENLRVLEEESKRAASEAHEAALEAHKAQADAKKASEEAKIAIEAAEEAKKSAASNNMRGEGATDATESQARGAAVIAEAEANSKAMKELAAAAEKRAATMAAALVSAQATLEKSQAALALQALAPAANPSSTNSNPSPTPQASAPTPKVGSEDAWRALEGKLQALSRSVKPSASLSDLRAMEKHVVELRKTVSEYEKQNANKDQELAKLKSLLDNLARLVPAAGIIPGLMATDEQLKEVKADRADLATLEESLNASLNATGNRIAELFKQLAALALRVDASGGDSVTNAAATGRQLLRDLYCLSCARPTPAQSTDRGPYLPTAILEPHTHVSARFVSGLAGKTEEDSVANGKNHHGNWDETSDPFSHAQSHYNPNLANLSPTGAFQILPNGQVLGKLGLRAAGPRPIPDGGGMTLLTPMGTMGSTNANSLSAYVAVASALANGGVVTQSPNRAGGMATHRPLPPIQYPPGSPHATGRTSSDQGLPSKSVARSGAGVAVAAGVTTVASPTVDPSTGAVVPHFYADEKALEAKDTLLIATYRREHDAKEGKE